MQQIIFAFNSYKNAILFSNKHNLWGYYIIPAIINLFIFIGLAYLFYVFGAKMVSFIENLLPLKNIENSWLSFLDIFWAVRKGLKLKHWRGVWQI